MMIDAVPDYVRVYWEVFECTRIGSDYLEVPYLRGKELFGGTPMKKLSDFLRVLRHF